MGEEAEADTLVLTAGSLADRLGRRRVFAFGLAVFSVASLLCALAPDPTFLNLSRALQGVGGAIMFAVSLALVAQEFPAGPGRGMAMGIYGATIGIAVAIGPLVGGLLTDGLGWEWVFLINVPIGIAAVAVTYWRLAESRDPNATRIDWAGPAHLLQRPLPARARAGPRQRRGLGQSADRLAAGRGRGAIGSRTRCSATTKAAITIASFIVAPMAGLALARTQARFLMSAGLALTGVGLLLMGGLGVDSDWTALLAGFILSGIGVGLLNPVIADVALSVVPKERSGMAAGINDTFRQVGIAVGIAAWGAIFLGAGAAKTQEVAGGGLGNEEARQPGRGDVVRDVAPGGLRPAAAGPGAGPVGRRTGFPARPQRDPPARRPALIRRRGRRVVDGP